MPHKIFVSPDSNDSNIGSLNMALCEVQEIKKNNGLPDGGISIILRGGYYFLDSPLVLSEQDLLVKKLYARLWVILRRRI